MEKKPSALVVKEEQVPQASPAEMIKAAVTGGANLEQLKGLLELQKDWEALEAKKAYNVAMAAFKANPPKITKDKKVSYSASGGQVNYNHASLANVVEKISAELSKHGLSASWKTTQGKETGISVTCKITHIKGHSEETTLSAPADKSGSKNDIQQIGSTITYLERYTLLALTGLATYDQDNDGRVIKPAEKPGETGKISDKELSQLRDLMIDAEANEKAFIGLLKVAKLEDLPKDRLEFAKKTLANIKASHPHQK